MSSEEIARLEFLATKIILQLLRPPEFKTISDIEHAAKDLALIEQMLTNACTGQSIRQRALYYRYAHLFDSQEHCNRHLRAILREAKCTQRRDFGIVPKPKGLIGGTLYRRSEELLEGPIDISEDLIDEIDWQETNRNTRVVLVVEKDAMFFSMLKCLAYIPGSLIITGRGFPDIETRRFICSVSELCRRELSVCYIGDFDPHGYTIYLTYRLGPMGKDSALEAPSNVCHRLVFGGLYVEDVKNTPCRLTLDTRDHSLLEGLKGRLSRALEEERMTQKECEMIQENLNLMSYKCEFEALFSEITSDEYLGEWLCNRLGHLLRR